MQRDGTAQLVGAAKHELLVRSIEWRVFRRMDGLFPASRQSMALPLRLLLASMLCVSGLAIATPPTHCTRGEITYFSCPIGSSGKVVSICGNRLTNEGFNQPARLQYRFGRLDGPELVFPTQIKGSVSRFRGEHHQGQTMNSSTVVFRSGTTEYSVRTFHSPMTGAAFDGITVSRPNRKLVSLPCKGQPTISLHFYTLTQDLEPVP